MRQNLQKLKTIMTFYDFISYPVFYSINATSLGIYRSAVFGFFLFWILFNFKDFIMITSPKSEAAHCKKVFQDKKKNIFCTHSNKYYLIVFIFIASCIFSCIGLFYNVSAIIFCFIFNNFQERASIFISTAGDNVIRCILLCLAISPCGYSFSIDSLLFNGKFIIPELMVPGASILCIQIMTIFMYFYAGICKINDKAWVKGTPMLIATRSPTWGKRNYITKIFKNQYINILSSRIIIFYQLFAPLFLFFKETQLIYAAIGIFIHFGMYITMHLTLFAPAMMLALASFCVNFKIL
jgi:hypothetical protein